MSDFIPLDNDLIGESIENVSEALAMVAKKDDIVMVNASSVASYAPYGLNQDHDEATMMIGALEVAIENMTRPQLVRLLRNMRKDGCPIAPITRGELKRDLQSRILHWGRMPRSVPMVKDNFNQVGVKPLSKKDVQALGISGVLGSRPGLRIDIDYHDNGSMYGIQTPIMTVANHMGVHQSEWIQTVNDNGKIGPRRKPRNVVEMTSRVNRGQVKNVERMACDENEDHLLNGSKVRGCVSPNGVIGYAKKGKTTCQVCGGNASVPIFRSGASRVNATFVPMLCIKPCGRFEKDKKGIKVVMTHLQKKSRRHQFKIDGNNKWIHGTAMRIEFPLDEEARSTFEGETIPIWTFVATNIKSGDYAPMALTTWEKRMLRTCMNVALKVGATYEQPTSKIVKNVGAI